VCWRSEDGVAGVGESASTLPHVRGGGASAWSVVLSY